MKRGRKPELKNPQGKTLVLEKSEWAMITKKAKAEKMRSGAWLRKAIRVSGIFAVLCLAACDPSPVEIIQPPPTLVLRLSAPFDSNTSASNEHEVYNFGEVQKERIVVNGTVYTDTSLWLEGKSYALAHSISVPVLITRDSISLHCTAFASFSFYHIPGVALTCKEDPYIIGVASTWPLKIKVNP